MATLNRPEFSCFIVVLNEGVGVPIKNVIPFQFMPDLIQENKAAQYNDILIMARSTPVKSYAYSGARNLSFTLDLFAQPEAGQKVPTPEMIKFKIDSLRSLVYPDYSSSFIMKPPPRCLVRIGAQLAFLGICRNVSVQYKHGGNNGVPWTIGPGALAHGASVSLTFEEVLNIPLDQTQITQGFIVDNGEFGGFFGGTAINIAQNASGFLGGTSVGGIF